MADPSIYSEIAKAVPVIVGGMLAVGGGIITQVVTHRLAVGRERRALQRERLESLVKALYADERWIMETQNMMVFRNEPYDVPSPLYEVRMLQLLHFPELAQEVCAVLETNLALFALFRDQRFAQMKNPDASKDWSVQAFADAHMLYLRAIEATTLKCRKMLGD